MTPPRVSRQSQVADLWGKAARERLDGDHWKRTSWDTHPITQRYINRRLTGNPSEHWLEFLQRRFAPGGADHGLSIGCGSGALERHALEIGLCRTMDGCDLSREALAVAQETALKEGCADRLRYFVCDLNSDTLGRHQYDICFSAAALHHVANLEHVLDEIRRALRPDGLFVLLEYVGPTRYQWSDKVQFLMNELLAVLPESYRMSITEPGSVRCNLERPSAESVASADPSEVIRSGEILEQLEQSFDILYRAEFGGTLLQFVLADIVGNFRAEDPQDRALLELLILFEETLITERVIPSDFVFVVSKSRHQGLAK